MASSSSSGFPGPAAQTNRIIFTQLIRLPSSLLAGTAGYVTTYALNSELHIQQYFLTASVLFCMAAASCTINDYWDVDKDRINHPDRPLPSGQLSLQKAWWTAVLLFIGALISALFLGIWPFVLTAISVVLLWYYSHLLKYSGILGNIIVAATIALLIFLSSLVAHRPFVMLYPMGFLFGYALAREIIFDVHDAEGDRAQGVFTIANQWGDHIAFSITWALLVVLLASLPIAFWLIPMKNPLWFGSFSVLLLLCFGIPLILYQQSRSANAYEHLLFWERLGMLSGCIGILGATPVL